MNKKVIGIIVALIILCAVGVTSFLVLNNKSKENEQQTNNNDNSEQNINNNDNQQNNLNDNSNNDNTNKVSDGKILVVYFSAQNHTREVAKKIANNLNADIFEIVPKDEYTNEDLNYGNSNSRVSKEHDDETLRNIELVSTEVPNWENYDTVLIGYPIWWGVAAWPVDTFVTSNDFTDKTVIPFCTSASSGLGTSGELLKTEAKGGNWLEGKRFSSNASDADIKSWTDSLK